MRLLSGGIFITSLAVLTMQSFPESAYSQVNSDSLFRINQYDIVFELEVDNETRTAVIDDLAQLLDDREIEINYEPSAVRFTRIIKGIEQSELYRIDYTPYQHDAGIPNPILLRLELDGVRRTFESVFEINGKESIYIPPRLIDIYVEQISFRKEHTEIFRELEIFIGRLNSIESEPPTLNTVVDLIYKGIGVDVADVLSQQDPLDLIDFLTREYYAPSILDVFSAANLYGDRILQMGIPVQSLIANLEVKIPEDKNAVVRRKREIYAIHTGDRWYIYD